MKPLSLTNPDGSTIPLINLSPLCGVSAGVQQQELVASDVVKLTVDSEAPIDFKIGAQIEVFGSLYTLNSIPKSNRNGVARFSYNLELEGLQYELQRAVFFDTDTAGSALSSSFSLTGNLAFFAQVLMNNINRVVSPKWGLSEVYAVQPGEVTPVVGSATETKTLTFDNENCLVVLKRLCEEYNTEFVVTYDSGSPISRMLSIKPAGDTLPYTFQYGQGNGIYELSLGPAQQPLLFCTRVYVFGGSKNLPVGYRNFATRLQLPLPAGPPLANPTVLSSYVESISAIGQYGLIESTKIFEEVYPTRTGTVTASTDQLTFTDTNIDFNPIEITGYETINGKSEPVYKYKIPGLNPKVHFQSGGLAGYTFDMVGFDVTTQTFSINPFTDERGLEFPAKPTTPPTVSPFRISAGDTYVLIDLLLPDEYVEAAEQKLLAAGQAYLEENSAPKIEFSLTLDEMYLQELATDTGPIPLESVPTFFAMGDNVWVVDSELGINRYARVIGLTRDILRPYKYTLTLGDVRRVSKLDTILRQQARVNRALVSGSLTGQPPGSTPVSTTPPETVKKKEQAAQVRGILENLGIYPPAADPNAPIMAGYGPKRPGSLTIGATILKNNVPVGSVVAYLQKGDNLKKFLHP